MRSRDEIISDYRKTDEMHTEAVKAELHLKMKLIRLDQELRDSYISEQISTQEPSVDKRDHLYDEMKRCKSVF